jgi:hypothetical protein
MFVIRLPNGNLMVPQTATGHDGRILGDVYVEIGPQDADYSRLAEQALTPEEVEQRRDRWRQDDEALRQEFLSSRGLTASTRGRTPPKAKIPEPADPQAIREPGAEPEPSKETQGAEPERPGKPKEPPPSLLEPPDPKEPPTYRRDRGWSHPPRHGQAAGWPCGDSSLSPRSRARTSDSRNLRCPPGVRILVIRPEAAHRVTVFGSTRNSAATSPGVRRRSLLPSTFTLLRLSASSLWSNVPLVWR